MDGIVSAVTSGTVNAAELLHTAQYDELDEVVARDLTRSLAHDGLRCSPSLFDILAEHGEARSAAPAPYDAPAIAVGSERLGLVDVTVARSAGLALGGAAAFVLVAGSILWYRWHPYGIAALVAGGVATAALGPGLAALDRRLPPGAPRGALLGAAVAAACTTVCLALLVALRRVTGA